MPDEPNSAATTGDFEFAALREANNYRRALIEEFSPFLRGAVLEVGAGIGQITEVLTALPSVSRVLALEPEPAFCAMHREQFPNHEIVQGTVGSLPGQDWGAILSINVLEHIEKDSEELAQYARLLKRRAGHFCLFVPARPEIFSPIDSDFGHFRRYTRPELRQKLEGAGFHVVRLSYFNLPGYFAWWLNFCFLKKRTFEVAKVRMFDRFIFPATHLLESRVMRPPFGQSLLAVARG
jgi:SAM-dependent methyltransferase